MRKGPSRTEQRKVDGRLSSRPLGRHIETRGSLPQGIHEFVPGYMEYPVVEPPLGTGASTAVMKQLAERK